MSRTTALTLGFVLVAAISPHAQQPVQPLALRANAAWSAMRAGLSRAFSYNPATIVKEMLLGTGALTREEPTTSCASSPNRSRESQCGRW